jgi:hypothetical protein
VCSAVDYYYGVLFCIVDFRLEYIDYSTVLYCTEVSLAIRIGLCDLRHRHYSHVTVCGVTGRNTESFDPRTTFVRPAMRIRVGPNVQQYNSELSCGAPERSPSAITASHWCARGVYTRVALATCTTVLHTYPWSQWHALLLHTAEPLKHDDVIVVPEFFCGEDDWSIYYKLVEEMREAQADQKNKSEWLPWHEGLHHLTLVFYRASSSVLPLGGIVILCMRSSRDQCSAQAMHRRDVHSVDRVPLDQ